MNIKSLLLGSAAAMVAVSGAQAADAIVVEPEPVEYVRVCDAYGTGYFFIPGTERCIRFSGFVRASVTKLSQEVTDSSTGAVLDILTSSTTSTTQSINNQFLVTTASDDVTGDANSFIGRARLDINVRSETDLGTLGSTIRLQAGDSNDPAAAAVTARVALITLAGWRFGQNGGNYYTTNHGFTGIAHNGISSDGFSGYGESMVIDYTWAADGLAITAGVENSEGLTALSGDIDGDNDIDVYGGFNYAADFGTLAFTAAYDSDATEVNTAGTVAGSVGGTAYKVSLTLNLADFIPGGRLHGFYHTDGDYTTSYMNQATNAGFVNVESAYGVNFQMDLTDEVQLFALWNHAEGGNTVIAGTTFNEGDAEVYSVGLNWFPASLPGFDVNVAYSHTETDRTAAFIETGAAGLVDVEQDQFNVTVRRSF